VGYRSPPVDSFRRGGLRLDTNRLNTSHSQRFNSGKPLAPVAVIGGVQLIRVQTSPSHFEESENDDLDLILFHLFSSSDKDEEETVRNIKKIIKLILYMSSSKFYQNVNFHKTGRL